ncbi:MAG: chromosomal replication initiator protein DnaA [Candidatus Pacebacteria bacterium]|nr:chromosomal replication initiator protein DnaA [Candidatus Paceibacterota bacterium]MDD3510227.1 chromosomal replication initiator protein DnaA [Candidatus Paceibacterota bacterium]MDD4664647.1 chromosomal replication initiator protein DnaA [Candidatus Paceibacterota bacterium]
MTQEQIWESVLAQIKLNVSSANFATWFANTKISEIQGGVLTISVPNSFSKEWLEQKYKADILKILESVDSSIKDINYTISPTKKTASRNTVRINNDEEQLGFSELEKDKETNLNPKYDLANLIVGPFNEMAYAAGEAIIESPGDAYNPFFIYGGVGLGKTHLIQGIGNRIRKKHPSKKIRYIPTERLVTDVVNSIRENKVEDLKKEFKTIDVLIIDDIQFISRKTKTQEEFFHIFNALYQENKQIILTSDKHPGSIETLADRLRSRFEGGMLADVQMPDLETRIAILKQKAEEKNFSISFEALEYIASNIQKNVRELEGALNKIILVEKINKRPSTLNDIKKQLKSLISIKTKITTPEKIIDTILDFYEIENKELFIHSRKKEYSRPRQLSMYLLKKELKLSYSAIGRKLGNKDHTTVMHSYALIEKEHEQNQNFSQEVEMILQRIYSNN